MVRVSSPKTQTMVRVNCQNGDGGGSWVGEEEGMDGGREAVKAKILAQNKVDV